MSFEDFNLIQKDKWSLKDFKCLSVESCLEPCEGLGFSFEGRSLWWKDLSGIYRGCTAGLLSDVGLNSPQEMIGKTDFDLSWSEQAELLRKNDRKVQDTGASISARKELVRLSNGTLKVFVVAKAPLVDEQGKIIGTIGNAVDITSTQELGKALIKSQCSEKKANVVKQSFMANMSHDVLTPIACLLGTVQGLRSRRNELLSLAREEGADYKEILCELLVAVEKDAIQMERQANDLCQLFRGILDATRIDSDLQEVERYEEAFDLNDLLDRQCTLIDGEMRKKSLELTCEVFHKQPPIFYGARLYLERIVQNLLSNAVKFTECGRVTVEASLTPIDELAYSIKISVHDTGLGIPREKFNVIFECFSRLTPSSQQKYAGIGNGLYAVKRYVEAMKGSVHFNSTEGVGTRFDIEVPLLINLVGMKQEKAVEEARKNRIYSVLVIEDNLLAAKAVEHLLKDLGCKVSIANTGKQGEKMAGSESYDLILMDIGLPDMDGLEVSNRIRNLSDKLKANVPIVVLSGHAKELPITSAADSAMISNYLEKPAKREQLVRILDEL